MLRPLCAALLLCAAVIPAAAQVPDALSGRWSGAAIYDGTVPTLFSLEIGVLGPDSLTTTLTQPYAGFDRFRFPFAYEAGRLDGELVGGLYGDEMRLLVDLASQTLRGTVVADGDTTATVYLQRVMDYALPGYRIEDVAFQAGEATIAGSLLVPEAPGPHPAAVLVPGRGYGSTRARMASYARLLARDGIAALVYDARGTGGSTGTDTLTTGAERAQDVGAALDALLARSDIRADAVGVLSYSAGGWVAPLALDGRDDVAFWVSLAGPTTNLVEQQGVAVEQYVARYLPDLSDAEGQAAGDYQRRLTALAIADAPWRDIAPLVAAAREATWAEAVDLPVAADDANLSYYRLRASFDPEAALRRLAVPTLAVYGSEDWIVPPTPHADRLRALAAESGHADVTVVVLDGAEHSLGRPGAVVPGAWPLGYARRWTRPPELYPTIVDWIQARTGLSD